MRRIAIPSLRIMAGALSFGGILGCYILTADADPLQNWILRRKGPPSGSLVTQWDVTFGNGLFVAVGHDGGDYGSIYTSPDGITWTARHKRDYPEATYGELRRILFGNGRFVAVGWSYAAYSSENGIDWSGGINPGLGVGLNEGFRDMCYAPGKFVAIDGSTQGSNVLSSADGRIWTRHRVTSPISPRKLLRIAHGNGRFVMTGEPDPFRGSTALYWSNNGVNWTSTTTSSLFWMTGLTWGRGLFVAVGSAYYSPNAPTILTSTDGIMWAPSEPGVTNRLSSVECINGLFIATGDSVLLTSTNGINWESRTTTNSITRFTFGQGTLVGISGGGGYAYWGPDIYQSDPLLQLRNGTSNPTELSLTGIVGQTIHIECADDASGPWRFLDAFPLPTCPYSWTDPSAINLPTRLYRTKWVP